MSASNVLIYGENALGEVKTIKCSDDGNLIISNSTAETSLIETNYFTGNLVAGTNLGTIDLGTRNIIQFGGKTDTETFAFIMEYSNDEINWNTDGYLPEITPVLTNFRFNITRTNVCMRYMRLSCVSDGDNVLIQYSATKDL